MDIMYDTKMYRKDLKSPFKGAYESFIGRLTPEERAQYDAFYAPIIEEFYKKNPQGRDLAEWKYQRYMRDYAKVVKSLDDNVGRVLDYLEAQGLLDNTLVVYTSDQGFYMGEHGWFDKRFMYEESMRTPLVMRLPKDFQTRGDIPQMVQNIDYAPTFLDLAGAPIPGDIQGVSLLPLLRGEKPADWRKSLYYHFYEYPAEHMVKRHYGVRTERYKLIHFYNDIDEWELYDLQEDPTEMHNLYGQPSGPVSGPYRREASGRKGAEKVNFIIYRMSGRPPSSAAHPPLSLLAEAKVCHLLQAAKNGVFVCSKNLLTKIGFRVNKTNALICREENDTFVRTKRCFPIGSAACVCCGFGCCTSLCFLCLHGSCGYTFRKAFIGLGNSR